MNCWVNDREKTKKKCFQRDIHTSSIQQRLNGPKLPRPFEFEHIDLLIKGI